MTYYDFSGAFQNLNSAIGGLRKQFDDDRRRQSLADLGKDIGAGNYDAAAQRAFALGDADAGIKIATLGKTARQEADWMTNNGGLLGLGNPQPVAPAQPSASSTATSQGETSFGDRSLPRGIRNNNPGNIEAGNFTAGLPGFKGSDGRFAQFETPEQGIVAADRLLQSYAGRGLNTVAGIVNRWAPPSENNTGAYVASVAKELGVDPSQPLDMTNPQVRQRLIAAKIRVENGRQPYGDDVFARAYGGGGAPQVAAPIVPVQTAALGAPSQPVAPISGDDPVKLRQDAERYAQSNPEAARQLLARADAAERGSGTQMAQAAPQAGTPMADLPAQGAAPAQGFAIPGGQQVESSIANDPRVMNLQRALAGAPDRFKPSIQSRLNILVEELKAQRQQQSPTDVQKNYAAARQQGYTGSLFDYQQALRQQNNVNIDQKGEGEYAKTVGKGLGERMDAISKEGDSARQDMAIIGQIRQLGGQIQNLGAGAALQARLADWGIKVGPNVSEIEAFNALVDKLTPQQRVPGTGASSDLDVRMFKSALPSLIRTPGGNELILSTLEAVANDKAARAAIADRALTGELKPQEAIKELRALPDPMAALKESRKDGFKSLPQLQQERRPPEPPRPPEAPSIPGARQAPDGRFYVPDPNRPGKYLQVQ